MRDSFLFTPGILTSLGLHTLVLGCLFLGGLKSKAADREELNIIQVTIEASGVVEPKVPVAPAAIEPTKAMEPHEAKIESSLAARPETRQSPPVVIKKVFQPKTKKLITQTQSIETPSEFKAAGQERTPSTNDTVSDVIFDAKLLGISPVYPRFARQHGQEGRVVCKVQITADGNVRAVLIVKSSGFPLLDGAAESAIREAKLQSGNNLPKGYSMVAVSFKLIQ